MPTSHKLFLRCIVCPTYLTLLLLVCSGPSPLRADDEDDEPIQTIFTSFHDADDQDDEHAVDSPDISVPFVSDDDFGHLHPTELIQSHGFTNVQNHTVRTENGYILTLWRIPGAPGKNGPTKGPVLLHHGLLMSGVDWFCIHHEKVLPYLLAESGFDVWLMNARGNRYSRDHETLHPSDMRYWKFGINEMATEDVPKIIDYILSQPETISNSPSNPQLSYVGYSMGTTIFYVATQKNPRLLSKFKSVISVAPAIYIGHLETPLKNIVKSLVDVRQLGKSLSIFYSKLTDPGPIYPEDRTNTTRNNKAPHVIKASSTLLLTICGYDENQANLTVYRRVLTKQPAGGSLDTINYFLNAYRDDALKRYTFKFPSSSSYNTPMMILWGEKDTLTVPKDVRRTIEGLRQAGQKVLSCPVRQFNHLDFVFGDEAHFQSYDRIMAFLHGDYRNSVFKECNL